METIEKWDFSGDALQNTLMAAVLLERAEQHMFGPRYDSVFESHGKNSPEGRGFWSAVAILGRKKKQALKAAQTSLDKRNAALDRKSEQRERLAAKIATALARDFSSGTKIKVWSEGRDIVIKVGRCKPLYAVV